MLHDPRNITYSPTTQEAYKFLHAFARAEGWETTSYSHPHGTILLKSPNHPMKVVRATSSGILEGIQWIEEMAHQAFIEKMRKGNYNHDAAI